MSNFQEHITRILLTTHHHHVSQSRRNGEGICNCPMYIFCFTSIYGERYRHRYMYLYIYAYIYTYIHRYIHRYVPGSLTRKLKLDIMSNRVYCWWRPFILQNIRFKVKSLKENVKNEEIRARDSLNGIFDPCAWWPLGLASMKELLGNRHCPPSSSPLLISPGHVLPHPRLSPLLATAV